MLITQKVYEKAPTGQYVSVLADYVDLGIKTNPFAKAGQAQERERILFTFILNKQDAEGNFYRVQREVTKSLHENSGLRKMILDMTGVNPGTEFELESLIGYNNSVVVKKGVSQTGKPKSTIESFLPATEKFAVPQGFVRKKDRPQQSATQPATLNTVAGTAAPATTAAPAPKAAVADEDIPF